MTSMGVHVVEGRGDGERAETARSRKFWAILIGLGVAGGIVGGTHSALTGGDLAGPIPAYWAIVLAVFYAVSIVIGSWIFFRSVDEVEVRDNLFAGTIGIYVYALIYPVWYLLAKGGVTVQPIGEVIFIVTMAGMSAAYFAKKIRP